MTDDKYLTRQTLLIRAQNQSDHEAWAEFIEVYKAFIYHILKRMNVKQADVDDLTQEILLRLWEKLDSYDASKGRFRTWMSFVIRNLVLNSIQKNNTRAQKLNQLAEDPSQPINFKENSDSELKKTIEREWKLYISNMALENIRELFSTNALEVFERSLNGQKNPQIVEELQLTESTVKVLKHRVKNRYITEVKRLITEFEGN